MRQRAKDRWAVFFGLLVIGLLPFGIAFAVWLQFVAPCDFFLFDLMKAGDLPGRCLLP